MNTPYAIIHQRPNSGEKVVDAPVLFIGPNATVKHIKFHMLTRYDCQDEWTTQAEIDAFNAATTLKELALWFDKHYSYFQLSFDECVDQTLEM